MSFPFTKQPDSMDCGTACLSMISQYYGKRYTLEYHVLLAKEMNLLCPMIQKFINVREETLHVVCRKANYQ